MNIKHAKASAQLEGRKMDEKKEVTGKFRFDQDSKRYHRFKIETESGIVGTVYIPKDRGGDKLPKKITLEYAHKATSTEDRSGR